MCIHSQQKISVIVSEINYVHKLRENSCGHMFSQEKKKKDNFQNEAILIKVSSTVVKVLVFKSQTASTKKKIYILNNLCVF